MKLEDILTLVKAGYTREEIAKLETPEPPAETASHSKTPEKAAPAEAGPTPPAKAPEEAKPAAPEKKSVGNDQVLGAINALTAAIQKMNVQSSSIPGGDDQEPTPEEILANIINPPKLKK